MLLAGNNSWAAFMFNALDRNGAPIVDGTYRMVVDAAGDGVVDPSIDTSGTWVWDADDILLDWGQIGGANPPGECYPFFSGARPNGIDATDRVYLIWIDKPWGSAKPGASTAYGYEDLGPVGAQDMDFTYYPEGGRAGGGAGNPPGGFTRAGQPDMRMTAFDVTPEPLHWGDTINWTATVVNQGTDIAPSFVVRLYLSTDSTITDSDYIPIDGLDSVTVTSLADGSSRVLNGSIVLPATPPVGFAETGTIYFGIIVDPANALAELNEANNSNQGVGIDIDAVDFVMEKPDLRVSLLEVTPGPLYWGDTITWTATVANLGGEIAPEFEVRLYLSSDAGISIGDYLSPNGLDRKVVTGLAAGATQVISGSITLPLRPPQSPAGFGQTGRFYFGTIVDPDNAISETDETNNSNQGEGVDVVAADFEAGQADLRVTSLSVTPGTLHWGDTFTWTAIVANEGNAGADSFAVRIYLSADATVDAADYLSPDGFGGATVTNLVRGTSRTITGRFTLPLNPPAGFSRTGTFYFGTIVDPANVVGESDETNNLNQGEGVDVAAVSFAQGAADLRVTSLSLTPASLQWGDTVKWKATVTNQGNAVAGSFGVRLFLSNDSKVTTADYAAPNGVAGVTVAGLARGATQTLSGSFKLPAAPPNGFGSGGTYYVGTIVDWAKAVAESNESNNSNQPGGIDVKPLVLIDWAYLSGKVLMVTGTAAADAIKVDVSAKGLTVQRNQLSKTFSLASITSIDVRAGAGDDVVTISAKVTKPARVMGEAGNNTILGGSGHDTLLGGSGRDSILGGDGNDELRGGSQNDVLRGGNGKDRLYGDDGNDSLYGDAHDDWLLGGNGNDLLEGGTHNNTLDGGAGRDTLLGGSGVDIFYADDGEADRLLGGAGLDSGWWDLLDIAQQIESKRS